MRLYTLESFLCGPVYSRSQRDVGIGLNLGTNLEIQGAGDVVLCLLINSKRCQGGNCIQDANRRLVVGIATFRDGEQVGSWAILVNPEDYLDPVNTSVHGIDEDAVAGAPVFPGQINAR